MRSSPSECLFRWATSCFRSSASAVHRAELEDPERPVALPHANLPEEHRPARVEPDRDRDDREHAAPAATRPTRERAMSIARFSTRLDHGRRAAGRPSSGMPSAPWIVVCGPSTSNRRGTTSTWTSSPFSSRIVSSVSVCGARENATITRSTSSAPHEPRELADVAEHGELFEIVVPHARMLVDEAHEVDAVLGVLQQLARDLLADVSCADDDRVLDVRVGAPADGTRGAPGEGDEDDRCRPEDEQLPHLRVRDAGLPGDHEEHPGTDRDHVEHAEHVVDRRVVGAGLVAVVEAVGAREQEPERQREHEADELRPDAEAIELGLGLGPEDDLRDGEREQEAHDVGGRERPLDQPAASPRPPEASLPDQVARALADEVLGGERVSDGRVVLECVSCSSTRGSPRSSAARRARTASRLCHARVALAAGCGDAGDGSDRRCRWRTRRGGARLSVLLRLAVAVPAVPVAVPVAAGLAGRVSR